jgi:menaquinol-cytochrome c reductase iron-sulfur subunit
MAKSDPKTTSIGKPVAGRAVAPGSAAASKPAAVQLPAQRAADRRGFFRKLAAVAIGGLVAVFPLAAGLWVFVDPLRRRAGAGGFVKVTTLDAVPDDGIPRRYTVSKTQVDAWNAAPNEPVGAVYLRRKKGAAVPDALQTTCPHAGCMVDYRVEDRIFKCPCHNSAFQLDGAIIQPSPAPRPMDSLACEVRNHAGVKEVWVEFENFYTGLSEKTVKT